MISVSVCVAKFNYVQLSIFQNISEVFKVCNIKQKEFVNTVTYLVFVQGHVFSHYTLLRESLK